MEILKRDLKQRIYIAKEEGFSYAGNYQFKLEDFTCVWGLIKAKRSPSFYGHDGYNNIGQPYYDIYLKRNPYLLITSNAWIVYRPRLSTERVFKVISVYDYSLDLICASCNLMQSTDFETTNTPSVGADYTMDGLL